MNLCLAFLELARVAVWLDHARRPRPSVLQIQAAVCRRFRLDPVEMTSARRARDVARPRQVAMYLSKQMTRLSLPQIGRRFGGRDHTTVIHACRQIERLRACDCDLDADVRALTAALQQESAR